MHFNWILIEQKSRFLESELEDRHKVVVTVIDYLDHNRFEFYLSFHFIGDLIIYFI